MYRACQESICDDGWIQTRSGLPCRSGQRASAESRACRISEMYVPVCASRRRWRTTSRSSSRDPRRLTVPVDSSSAETLNEVSGECTTVPAPASPMPTAAIEMVRRERRNVGGKEKSCLHQSAEGLGGFARGGDSRIGARRSHVLDEQPDYKGTHRSPPDRV